MKNYLAMAAGAALLLTVGTYSYGQTPPAQPKSETGKASPAPKADKGGMKGTTKKAAKKSKAAKRTKRGGMSGGMAGSKDNWGDDWLRGWTEQKK